jgi:hypothetical protein
MMLNLLASPQLRHDHRNIIRKGWRRKQGNVFADYLCFGVPVEALGSLIPAGDNAVQRFTQDGIIGRLHNRRQPGLVHLGCPLRF